MSVVAFRARRRAPVLGPAEARERSVRRRVAIVWGLLVLNVLTYYRILAAYPVGGRQGHHARSPATGATRGADREPQALVRPNVFLCLVSLLVIEAIVTSLQPQYLGTVYRTFRLAEFVAVLWLLTPWWGRRDLLLVRCHLASLAVVLGSVLLGLLVAPGHAMAGGRLSGVLWAIPATQVAHYAAVTLGLVVVLWLCGQVRGRATLLIAVVTVAILLLTHTRTALVGMVAGILVAGLSLIVAKARVRKFFAAAGIVASIAIITLSSVIDHLAGPGRGHAAADRTHRPDQGLGSRFSPFHATSSR